MFLLDTNTLSEANRPALAPPVVRWLARNREGPFFVSVMSFSEIARGIERLPDGRRRRELEEWLGALLVEFEGRILTVSAEIAMRWGRMRIQQERLGRTPPFVDLMIAATALDRRLTVVSRNVKDFEPLGVPVVNPWDDENGA